MVARSAVRVVDNGGGRPFLLSPFASVQLTVAAWISISSQLSTISVVPGSMLTVMSTSPANVKSSKFRGQSEIVMNWAHVVLAAQLLRRMASKFLRIFRWETGTRQVYHTG